MYSNYVFSDQDQLKLLRAGWTLYSFSREHAMYLSMSQADGVKSFTLPSKSQATRQADLKACEAKSVVAVQEYGLRPRSIAQLCTSGYKLVRRYCRSKPLVMENERGTFEMQVGEVRYYKYKSGPFGGGAWGLLAGVEAVIRKSGLDAYMYDILQDDKTLEY